MRAVPQESKILKQPPAKNRRERGAGCSMQYYQPSAAPHKVISSSGKVPPLARPSPPPSLPPPLPLRSHPLLLP